MIYLDYNATTPIDPRVAEAMQPFLSGYYGNPSSGHRLGKEANEAVEKARQQVAECIGASPESILFTGGGSESNNLALKGVIESAGGQGRIITSSFEHPAVSEVCDWLSEQGTEIDRVSVGQDGIVEIPALLELLQKPVNLVSIMHANNEIGTVQPITEIAEAVLKVGALVHTDAAQSLGKVPVNVNDLGVDLLTIAGHKLYTHKGIGALYVRDGVHLAKQIHGASHERNLRAGTENVLQIVGLGKACEIIRLEQNAEQQRLQEVRDMLWKKLVANVPGLRRNGDLNKVLPNTLSLIFPGVSAELLFQALPDVALSAGAACHSDESAMSDTLRALGLSAEEASNTVRLSIGRMTSVDEINRASEQIITAWKMLTDA